MEPEESGERIRGAGEAAPAYGSFAEPGREGRMTAGPAGSPGKSNKPKPGPVIVVAAVMGLLAGLRVETAADWGNIHASPITANNFNVGDNTTTNLGVEGATAGCAAWAVRRTMPRTFNVTSVWIPTRDANNARYRLTQRRIDSGDPDDPLAGVTVSTAEFNNPPRNWQQFTTAISVAQDEQIWTVFHKCGANAGCGGSCGTGAPDANWPAFENAAVMEDTVHYAREDQNYMVRYAPTDNQMTGSPAWQTVSGKLAAWIYDSSTDGELIAGNAYMARVDGSQGDSGSAGSGKPLRQIIQMDRTVKPAKLQLYGRRPTTDPSDWVGWRIERTLPSTVFLGSGTFAYATVDNTLGWQPAAGTLLQSTWSAGNFVGGVVSDLVLNAGETYALYIEDRSGSVQYIWDYVSTTLATTPRPQGTWGGTWSKGEYWNGTSFAGVLDNGGGTAGGDYIFKFIEDTSNPTLKLTAPTGQSLRSASPPSAARPRTTALHNSSGAAADINALWGVQMKIKDLSVAPGSDWFQGCGCAAAQGCTPTACWGGTEKWINVGAADVLGTPASWSTAPVNAYTNGFNWLINHKYEIQARSVDSVGNLSAVDFSTFTYDQYQAAPEVPTATVTVPSPGYARAATITGTAEDNTNGALGSVTWYISSGPYFNTWMDNITGNWFAYPYANAAVLASPGQFQSGWSAAIGNLGWLTNGTSFHLRPGQGPGHPRQEPGARGLHQHLRLGHGRPERHAHAPQRGDQRLAQGRGHHFRGRLLGRGERGQPGGGVSAAPGQRPVLGRHGLGAAGLLHQLAGRAA